MSFNIVYTEQARQNLHETHAYIHSVLLEPETANKQLQRIIDAVNGLDHLPFRHRIYDVEPWHSKGWRIFPVDNFLIFYMPDEETTTVTIFRIIFGSRNIEAQLEQRE